MGGVHLRRRSKLGRQQEKIRVHKINTRHQKRKRKNKAKKKKKKKKKKKDGECCHTKLD